MNEGKNLLVLGASSDLGVTLIKKVIGEYACILAHYRNMSKELQELVNKYKDKIKLINADFSNELESKKMIETIKIWGLIPTDIVHFSSSYAEQSRFHQQNWSNFQKLIDSSLRPIVDILREFIPEMGKKRRGRVIIMLTAYTLNMPPKYLSAYVTIKYALLGLVKSLAMEYANKGITVNGISPEMIETKFLQNIPQIVVRSNAEQNPSGRNLVTMDVIPVVKFLLSNEATFITGQNIAITGGKF